MIFTPESLRANCKPWPALSCFPATRGLRYSDTRKVINEKDLFAQKFLSIRQKKGNKPLDLKLSDRALKVLHSPHLVKCTTNKNNNARLPEVLEKIGVSRHVTFHGGRHTYACLSLEMGIPVAVVQKLLNHSDIRTTMIYAKIVDETKNAAVDLWDKAKKQPD